MGYQSKKEEVFYSNWVFSIYNVYGRNNVYSTYYKKDIQQQRTITGSLLYMNCPLSERHSIYYIHIRFDYGEDTCYTNRTSMIVGCSEVYEPDIEQVDPFLSIEGYISSVPGTQYVYIRQSKPYNDRPLFCRRNRSKL